VPSVSKIKRPWSRQHQHFSTMRLRRRSDGRRDDAPAQRHGELVADLAPERAVLRDAKGWASDGRHYTATLSLSPSARITFRTVANSGFPSVESAL
jgi:hypothetical protein